MLFCVIVKSIFVTVLDRLHTSDAAYLTTVNILLHKRPHLYRSLRLLLLLILS
jgi:hypothetical protein